MVDTLPGTWTRPLRDGKPFLGMKRGPYGGQVTKLLRLLAGWLVQARITRFRSTREDHHYRSYRQLGSVAADLFERAIAFCFLFLSVRAG